MNRVALASLALALSSAQAFAYQSFIEYRIPGNEIRSARIEPPEMEAPSLMVIETDPDVSGTDEIAIESDDDLDACMKEVESVIGDAAKQVTIVIDTTAQTMNGVIVTECTAGAAVE